MTLLLLFACQPSIGKSGETATSDPASSDYDVIVIGSGPAGLAATFEAVSGGARVLTLERSDHYGGNDQGGGSLMMFSGTPEEEAAGVVDSPEQLLSEWPSFTGGDPDDPWVQYFAYNNVVRVHDWLADLGLDWLAPVADSSGGTTARLHELDRDGMSISDAIAVWMQLHGATSVLINDHGQYNFPWPSQEALIDRTVDLIVRGLRA